MHSQLMTQQREVLQQELDRARVESEKLRILAEALDKKRTRSFNRVDKLRTKVESLSYFGIEDFFALGSLCTYQMQKDFFKLGPFQMMSGMIPSTKQRCLNLQINANWNHLVLVQVALMLDTLMEHVKPIDDPAQEISHGKKYLDINTDDLSESGCVYALQASDGLWTLMIDVYRRPNVIKSDMTTIEMLMYMQHNGHTYKYAQFKHGFGFGGFID